MYDRAVKEVLTKEVATALDNGLGDVASKTMTTNYLPVDR